MKVQKTTLTTYEATVELTAKPGNLNRTRGPNYQPRDNNDPVLIEAIDVYRRVAARLREIAGEPEAARPSFVLLGGPDGVCIRVVVSFRTTELIEDESL